ncbi:MAG: hypothetical protein GKR96_08345 [Gammaproteobacteria bacterium]|nr:hypothetical protein [Gammaproteobacteria bacterium]
MSMEKVSFFAQHQPTVKSGEYTVNVSQVTPLLGSSGSDLTTITEKTIYVAGTRFSIDSHHIFRQFPLPKTTGDYHSVLPSITLKNSTLPWERFAIDNQDDLPWMWLFVYDDNDLESGYVKTQSQKLGSVFYLNKKKPSITKMLLDVEPGEEKRAGVLKGTVIETVKIKLDWLEANRVFPSNDELKLLTCVRQNNVDGVDTKHAICIANRLPKAGVRSYACLLSLEGRLSPTGDTSPITPAYKVQGVDNGYTTFINLAHWSFASLDDHFYEVTTDNVQELNAKIPDISTDLLHSIQQIPKPSTYTCTRDFLAQLTFASGEEATIKPQFLTYFQTTARSFHGLLTKASSDSFRWPSSVTSGVDSPTLEYLDRGAVAVPYTLSTGKQTLGWYHGPFRSSTTQSTEDLPKSILSSDQLLRFDPASNMLNTAEATAWQLGRMLTLNKKPLAMDLYLWKRHQVQKQHQSTSQAHKTMNPGLLSATVAKEEQAIADWCKSLVQLKNIPFHYLVSDERLLPTESIRFFTLDNLWLRALVDGALSIGRVSQFDPQHEKSFLTDLSITSNDTAYSGFLLRSEAVSGWPHLEIHASDNAGSTLKHFSKQFLNPSLLLFLCEGELDEVDIHLKPEALHFGFDVDYSESGESRYSKQIRFHFSKDATDEHKLEVIGVSENQIESKPIVWKNQDYKVLDIEKLAITIQAGSQIPIGASFTSAQLALEMIEGVPNVCFQSSS